MGTLETHYRARREDGGADIGDDPVGAFVTRPTVDEQTDGDQYGAWDHQGDPEFRLADVVVAQLQLAVDPVVDGGADLGAQEETQPERNVVEAADSGLFVVGFGPDGGEGGKNEIHETVEVGPMGLSVKSGWICVLTSRYARVLVQDVQGKKK